MSTLLALLVLLAPPGQSPQGASGSVVSETGQVRHFPAAVALSLAQRSPPYLNSCWLNSDTASLYLPPPLAPEEEGGDKWERAIQSPHFRLLLSEPLLLGDAVGGQEISEIVFTADRQFVLSRHHGRVTEYRRCELRWTDVTCATDLEPYLPAEYRSTCELRHRMPLPRPVPRQTLTLVFIRQTDLGNPLTIADDRQFLRPEDLDLLESSGLSGRLTAEGYSSQLEGRVQARALVVLSRPLDHLHRLPVPSAATVVYTQQDSGFAAFPPAAAVGAESIELYPDEESPATVMYRKKLATGWSGGQALIWSAGRADR